MIEVDDLTREFLIECNENLDNLDRDIVELEKDPTNKELLQNIFRYVHSIKGTSGCLGFGLLERVTHAGENLLSKMRDGEFLLDQNITTALLQMLDAVRQILAQLEATGREGEEEFKPIIDTFARLLQVRAGGGAAASQSSAEEGLEPKKIGALLLEAELVDQDQLLEALVAQEEGDPRHVGELLVERAQLPAEVVKNVLAVQREQQQKHAAVSDATIRVDVGLIDKLMNLVGEMVLTRNQILQHVQASQDSNLLASAQKLDLLTSELQEGVMKTRMQPIRNIWSKLPRVVRDLSTACGKQVRLEMSGEDTELDKTIIEAVKDPLNHVIRNSIDHGIESPADRYLRGKAEEGVVRLAAFHEGGQVNIVVSDDGGGLDPEKIRSKALERGLITRERAEAMDERDFANLIFLPGFSTAEKVTNISGRGVGMDVVKTYIEKIGGSIDLQSELGVGTTLRIRIPLTLAIIPALLLTCRHNRYAVPQINVLELVRVDPAAVKQRVEYVHDAPVYRLRDELLPLVSLEQLLHGQPFKREHDGETPLYIVVLQADRRAFGLVVDKIVDTQEIVVKPLSRHFRMLDAYAGATIMGDGGVAMILDAAGLARRGGLTEPTKKAAAPDKPASGSTAQRRSFLLVKAADAERLAFPLDAVARLEHIAFERVERAGGREVVQYRSQVMPLISVTRLFYGPSANGSVQAARRDSMGDLNVVVCRSGSSNIGVVVDEILDIVEDTLEMQTQPGRPNLECVGVIQGKVTEVLDMAALAPPPGNGHCANAGGGSHS